MSIHSLIEKIHHKKLLWWVYSLAAVVVSVQKLAQGRGASGYTSYENYLIFKQSFPHLLAGLNPYAQFPAEQWDLFKYSPAFAIFMAPFSMVPDWLGLPVWNLLNVLVLLSAIFSLPDTNPTNQRFIAWFVLLELITSIQNSQSNGLMAGMLLWTWIAFERQQPLRAAFWVIAATFIKIFGIFAAFLWLLYPKQRTFIGWMAAWGLFFAACPLLLLSPEQVTQVYQWWWQMLQGDHSASIGLSVMGWLQTWFGLTPSKVWVTAIGFMVLGLSIFKPCYHWDFSPKNSMFRLEFAPPLVVASLMIWVVIFNHKAESPTFIIAMCGVALWYVEGTKSNWEKGMLGFAFLFVSLSPTDIFPRPLREAVVQPYVLKAVPCIIIWFLITYRLFKEK